MEKSDFIEDLKKELKSSIDKYNTKIENKVEELASEIRNTYPLVYTLQFETLLAAEMELELDDWACFSNSEEAHKACETQNMYLMEQKAKEGHKAKYTKCKVVTKSSSNVSPIVLCKIDELKRQKATYCLCFNDFKIRFF